MQDESKLIDCYGYNPLSRKWMLPGAEILKYINQPVMCLDFTKVDNAWKLSTKKAVIKDISNFNPTSMTYKCLYELEDNGVILETEIVPDGFSYGNAEELNKLVRFIPFSLHCEMTETELFLDRVTELYNTKKPLDIAALKLISESGEQDKTLRYCRNIGLAVKLNSGNTLWIRLQKIVITHCFATKYSITVLSVNGDSMSFQVDSTDKEFDFENLGTFKILDLKTDNDEDESTIKS